MTVLKLMKYDSVEKGTKHKNFRIIKWNQMFHLMSLFIKQNNAYKKINAIKILIKLFSAIIEVYDLILV